MYSDKVIEIFKDPKNVGEMKDPSGVGTVGNEVCGDIMKLYLKIDDNQVITDAKFKTFGCAAAIVSSSVATEIIKGRTVEDALKLENQEILDYLGGLPPQKIHCSVLAKEAIEEAVKDYRNKQARGKKKVAEKQKISEKAIKESSVKSEKKAREQAVRKDDKKSIEEQVKEPRKTKLVKLDVDELIRTSNQLLTEIESSKLLRKAEKNKKSAKKEYK